MPSSLWTGSISFGLVNVPVRLFGAQRGHEVRFHQINRATGHRIKYEKVDATTGVEVEADQIVRGIESAGGKLVTIDDAELDALQPKSTHTVDVEDFVDLAEIDPIYYDRTYFVAPDDRPGAARAYALLVDAMRRTGQAGIGKIVIRRKQYLAALRPYENVMVMSTMRFADEVVVASSIDSIPDELPPSETKARQMAESLIESLTAPFEPQRYRDTYTEELLGLIESKAEGATATVVEHKESAPEVADLLAALKASVEDAKQRRPLAIAKPARSAKPKKRTRSGDAVAS